MTHSQAGSHAGSASSSSYASYNNSYASCTFFPHFSPFHLLTLTIP
jgi:hypothetical protein